MPEIQSFLGIFGYYQRFVEGFSWLFGPLTTLTKKNVEFVWIDKCERCFQELKRRLTTAPILALPESHKLFVVFIDVSKFGLGCVLIQEGQVVAYAPRQLKDHEGNLHLWSLPLKFGDNICMGKPMKSTLTIRVWSIYFLWRTWIWDRDSGYNWSVIINGRSSNIREGESSCRCTELKVSFGGWGWVVRVGHSPLWDEKTSYWELVARKG